MNSKFKGRASELTKGYFPRDSNSMQNCIAILFLLSWYQPNIKKGICLAQFHRLDQFHFQFQVPNMALYWLIQLWSLGHSDMTYVFLKVGQNILCCVKWAYCRQQFFKFFNFLALNTSSPFPFLPLTLQQKEIIIDINITIR